MNRIPTLSIHQRYRLLQQQREQLYEELNRANDFAYKYGRGFDAVELIDIELQKLDETIDEVKQLVSDATVSRMRDLKTLFRQKHIFTYQEGKSKLIQSAIEKQNIIMEHYNDFKWAIRSKKTSLNSWIRRIEFIMKLPNNKIIGDEEIVHLRKKIKKLEPYIRNLIRDFNMFFDELDTYYESIKSSFGLSSLRVKQLINETRRQQGLTEFDYTTMIKFDNI